jgi:hypothetical protein
MLDSCYPGFDLAAHKGYSTPAHLEALRRREPTPLHRKSFNPVKVAFDAKAVFDGSAAFDANVGLDGPAAFNAKAALDG